MSVRAHAGRGTDRKAGRGVSPAIVLAGIVMLCLRIYLPGLGAQERALALAALTSSVLISCLLVPVPRSDINARISPATGLVVGFVGVGVATLMSDRPSPLPFAWWALPLSVLAAVAEEALFRRVAYGWLARWGAVVAIVGSAVMFASIHLPLYGVAVFPVDLGAGLLFSWQRWATGSWGVPAATHAAANVVATVLR